MKQANCIITMMEKLIALSKQMKTSPPEQTAGKLNKVKYQSQKGKPCMFNLNCPANRCPFRTGKAANEFVNDLVDGTRPATAFSLKKRLNKREIVDNADLFVVNVGRVDPCRVVAPLVYKDGCTQYLETDFSKTLLPPKISVVEEEQIIGKKAKKSKKSKKAKA